MEYTLFAVKSTQIVVKSALLNANSAKGTVPGDFRNFLGLCIENLNRTTEWCKWTLFKREVHNRKTCGNLRETTATSARLTVKSAQLAREKR